MPSAGRLKQRTRVSQRWRLEVQDQGAGRRGPGEGPPPGVQGASCRGPAWWREGDDALVCPAQGCAQTGFHLTSFHNMELLKPNFSVLLRRRKIAK